MTCVRCFAKEHPTRIWSPISVPLSWKKRRAIASTSPASYNPLVPWYLSAGGGKKDGKKKKKNFMERKEERRGGEEGRKRWGADQYKKKKNKNLKTKTKNKT